MANEPIFVREALRRFREEQARKERAAKNAASKRQAAKLAGKPAERRQVQICVTVEPAERAKLQKLARAAGLTISNYMRKRAGMPPIHRGRPKRNEN